jgi:hypothetical protein
MRSESLLKQFANLLNPTQLWVVNVVEAPQVARLTHHEAQIPVCCTG